MKINKYKSALRSCGRLISEKLWSSKEQAMQYVEDPFDGGITKEYLGVVEIDLYCDSCNKDLNIGDEYIVVDDYTRFCSDCYEEESFTYYIVDGDEVGNENDTILYDEWETEGDITEVVK